MSCFLYIAKFVMLKSNSIFHKHFFFYEEMVMFVQHCCVESDKHVMRPVKGQKFCEYKTFSFSGRMTILFLLSPGHCPELCKELCMECILFEITLQSVSFPQ